jgi:aquaporin Z
MTLNECKQHVPEYLIEACGLATFMISACAFGALLEHPSSPVRQAMAHDDARRVLMGLAMGLTAVSIIYSPWGKRSGAHINPAVTLTFWRLGKVKTADAVFYIAAQFIGGWLGVEISSAVLRDTLQHPSVNYVATLPGRFGAGAAFLAEFIISFVMMSVVLRVSNHARWARYTGLCAGALVMAYISLEAPLSGMSMNPARTFGSAAAAQLWTELWLYFTAPPLAMLAAAQVYLWQKRQVACAKLHHQNNQRCIHCGTNVAQASACDRSVDFSPRGLESSAD